MRGALALGLCLPLSAGLAQSPDPSATDLFRAYRLRQFDQVSSQLAGVRDFGALRKQIAREGGAWPLEARAAFLLEVADAALQRRERPMRTGPEVGLFEDACQTARRLAPLGEFDSAWQAAALSVLSAPYAAGISVDGHLTHMRGRYDEGQIAMKRAMPRERLSWHEATQVQPTLTGPAQHDMNFAFRSRLGRAGMRDVVKLFETARRYESARAEATLRQAALLATWEEHGEALPLLAEFDGLSDDPWLRHMAALLSGRSLEAAGRGTEAQAAYRSAITLQANGKAARLALASIVFASGGREEADRLVSEALTEQPGPPDPWSEFLGGDFRFLDARRAAMREHVR